MLTLVSTGENGRDWFHYHEKCLQNEHAAQASGPQNEQQPLAGASCWLGNDRDQSDRAVAEKEGA
jgi:hypothetical protein